MLFRDLDTERLLLKSVSMEDARFLFRQFSDPVVCRYLFDEEPLTDVSQAEELIAFFCMPEPRSQHRWVVVRKEDGALMGTCGFHRWDRSEGAADTGYDLREEFWGQGYMVEAMREILRFAKESMHLDKINAVIYPGNLRSIALAEKLGFMKSGETFETFRGERILHDIYTFEVKS